MEAQLAPVNGIVAADFDLDGFTDLFIGQNEFQLAPVRSPLGSGRGWLLRGQGDGRFEPLSLEASGIDIQGEMQGAAGGDYDRDGRWDLVVGVYREGLDCFMVWVARVGAFSGLSVALVIRTRLVPRFVLSEEVSILDPVFSFRTVRACSLLTVFGACPNRRYLRVSGWLTVCPGVSTCLKG